MKRIILILICFSVIFCLGNCSDTENTNDSVSSNTASSPQKTVSEEKTVILEQENISLNEDKSAIYKQFKEQANTFAEKTGKKAETLRINSDDAVKTIVDNIVDGAKTVILIGPEFSRAVKSTSASFENVKFILIDGMLSDSELTQNILQISFSYEQTGFAIGYTLVYSGVTNPLVLLDETNAYEYKFINGIAMGADFALKEKNVKLTSENAVTASIECRDISKIPKTDISEILENRKKNRLFHIVCIGNNASSFLEEQNYGMFMITDTVSSYKKTIMSFSFAGNVDISDELDNILNAGDSWSKLYGGKTVRFGLETENTVFTVNKLKNAYFRKITKAIQTGNITVFASPSEIEKTEFVNVTMN